VWPDLGPSRLTRSSPRRPARQRGGHQRYARTLRRRDLRRHERLRSEHDSARAAPRGLLPDALRVRRSSGPIVGRRAEQDAIRQELASTAAGRLSGVTLEGEPVIGKTRLLLAAGEMAAAGGFTTAAVTVDEELRGPFLLARSIVGSAASSPASGRQP
jgi:hypothetical protein